jgi:hypothetical protein
MHTAHYEAALEKFGESQRVAPASGTALDIAYCDVELGRVASAWFMYRQALALAEAQGKPEHARIARTEADKLEPDLPRLELRVEKRDGHAPTVSLDGAPLSPNMLSVPIPVDPGPHEIRAGNPSAPWTKAIAAVRNQIVTVDVPAPPAREPALLTSSAPAAVPEHTARRTWALALGGVGAAGAVVGIALFASARLEYDGAASHCPANACDDQGYASRRSAAGRGEASYFVLGGGAALLATSAVLWFGDSRRAGATSMRLGATRSTCAVTLTHAF